MAHTKPIGIFDSGIGGVTILKEIVALLPNENMIYISDDKNCPYGTKSTQEIINLSRENTKRLIGMGAKIIVVACNTATMAAVESLRSEFNIEFIAIEPAIKPASSATKSGVVGILATKSSIESDHLKKLCEKYAYNKITVSQAGVGLVKLVEQDKQDSEESYKLLKKYINPMIEKGIDHLVLGCTHYPFFKKWLEKITENKNIVIVNPAKSIANQLQRVLANNNLLSDSKDKGEITFISTTNDTEGKRIEDRFYQYIEIDK